jgi:hypothetical protein
VTARTHTLRLCCSGSISGETTAGTAGTAVTAKGKRGVNRTNSVGSNGSDGVGAGGGADDFVELVMIPKACYMRCLVRHVTCDAWCGMLHAMPGEACYMRFLVRQVTCDAW